MTTGARSQFINAVRRAAPCGLPLLAAVALLAHSPASAGKSPHEWALVSLEYARSEKARQLRRFCDRIHALASGIAEDDVMCEFFDVSRKYRGLTRANAFDAESECKMERFRKAVNAYYVENYLAFYDILFVDARGDLFHSIRKESDSQGNLLEGASAQTPLARCLRSAPRDERFIDFHDYAPSGEPAAFFVEPVRRGGELTGWFVLQCATNKINSLFAGAEQLGETGETFLVNRSGYMLTESNFQGDSAILKRRLAAENIDAKFREKQGDRRVIDYRGVPAITSFEVFDFLGAQWLVVAKVDEAQITTGHFMQHRPYYTDRILRRLKQTVPASGKEPFSKTRRKVIRVDMDEFVRANHGEVMQTLGVSACTAVIATYPGKFGYMAHASPYDKMYGGEATNLLGHIVKKIKTYDIYKCERRQVRFVVVARHFDSLPYIIGKLADEGFLLSQISVLYHPRAQHANVTYDYSEDRISVAWRLDQPATGQCVHHGDDAVNLGAMVREDILGEHEKAN